MSFDLLIPAKDASRVTLDAVGRGFGYNVLVEEGPNANLNRQQLLRRSTADFCIFADDTDDEILNIRKDLEQGFEGENVDAVFFNYTVGPVAHCSVMDYSNCHYVGHVLDMGAGPWSIALRRGAIVSNISEIFPMDLVCWHGSYALTYLFYVLGCDRVVHLPKCGYNWNVSPHGITARTSHESISVSDRNRLEGLQRRVNGSCPVRHLT